MIDTSAAPTLELRNVTKSYPGQPPVVALDDVSLTVPHGGFVAIVGPSGSGKSTLLNIVGTLDRPTSGQVSINGNDVSNLPDRMLSAVRSSLLGFVFQQFFLLDGTSALDNVANGLLYSGGNRNERRERAAEALKKVGLEHRLFHLPNELSGGEKQRVAIARAIVGRPQLVLADEPTGALDTKTSDSIVALLTELNEAGSTILVITHDRELAARLPRQVRFRDGCIVEDVAAGALR